MNDDKTSHLNLPLPHVDNLLEEDVTRLRAALVGVDTAVEDLQQTVSAAMDVATAASGTAEWAGVDGKPESFTPAEHTHGGISADGKVGTAAGKPLITGSGGTVQAGAFGSTSGKFCEGNDSRLSDSRTPEGHAGSHKPGGTDEIGSAEPAPNALILTGADGKFPVACMPDIFVSDAPADNGRYARQNGEWVASNVQPLLIASWDAAVNTEWVVPDRYSNGLPYLIEFALKGGGAGGQGGGKSSANSQGGGEGGYVRQTLLVIPGAVMPVVVGAGGTGGAGGSSVGSGGSWGTGGGTSSFAGFVVYGGTTSLGGAVDSQLLSGLTIHKKGENGKSSSGACGGAGGGTDLVVVCDATPPATGRGCGGHGGRGGSTSGSPGGEGGNGFLEIWLL